MKFEAVDSLPSGYGKGMVRLSLVGVAFALACSSSDDNPSDASSGGAPGNWSSGAGGASGASSAGNGGAAASAGGLVGAGRIIAGAGAVIGAGGVIGTAGSANPDGGLEAGGSTGAGGTASADGATGTGGAAATGGAASTGFDHELLGVYCGNSTSDVTQFEGWLGRQVDGILGYTGNASWSDYDGSVGWAAGLWAALDRRVLWSVPLIPTGASLAEAAAGSYDDHYKKAAQTLATFRTQESVLYIRTGWEFNGDWFPWAAKGKAQDFAGAFRHFVTAFRGVSSRFRFEWNVNVGDVGMNPEDAYPGDDIVDIVGMDFYWNTQWDPKDPAAAWNSMVTRTYGLSWHQDFAKAHGKPTAYSEWGVMADGAETYIQNAKTWFTSHDVVYQTYWNSDNAFQGKLSSGQYPSTGAAYRTAFGP
jgi:hypothetical protein